MSIWTVSSVKKMMDTESTATGSDDSDLPRTEGGKEESDRWQGAESVIYLRKLLKTVCVNLI